MSYSKSIGIVEEPSNMDEFFESVLVKLNRNFANRDIHIVNLRMNLRYDNNVKNSHCAPVNGFTNWGGRNKKAKGIRGYPGFQGRVWLRFSSNPEGLSENWFNDTLSHTSTGGSGVYDGDSMNLYSMYATAPEELKKSFTKPAPYSWGYSMFLMDFPLIEKNILQQEVWNKLKYDDYNKRPAQVFERGWTCPIQAKKDADFIRSIMNKDVDIEDGMTYNY